MPNAQASEATSTWSGIAFISIRTELGLSQTDFAEILGLSVDLLDDWEGLGMRGAPLCPIGNTIISTLVEFLEGSYSPQEKKRFGLHLAQTAKAHGPVASLVAICCPEEALLKEKPVPYNKVPALAPMLKVVETQSKKKGRPKGSKNKPKEPTAIGKSLMQKNMNPKPLLTVPPPPEEKDEEPDAAVERTIDPISGASLVKRPRRIVEPRGGLATVGDQLRAKGQNLEDGFGTWP